MKSLKHEIKDLYNRYDKMKTYEHVEAVSKVATELAKVYHLDVDKCVIASLLHDISVIISADDMYDMAIRRNMKIDRAEEKYHFLLHQRISRMIARERFDINDEMILSAIECHTTLKRHASDYDKVVFIADKIAWDQEGKPPYYDELIKALEVSLDNGCYCFIKYQFDHHQLLMPHSWLIEAFDELKLHKI